MNSNTGPSDQQAQPQSQTKWGGYGMPFVAPFDQQGGPSFRSENGNQYSMREIGQALGNSGGGFGWGGPMPPPSYGYGPQFFG